MHAFTIPVYALSHKTCTGKMTIFLKNCTWELRFVMSEILQTFC